MIYILGIVVYLAIGGLLAGLFEDMNLDDFMWYIFWPFVCLIILIIIVEEPFTNFGRYIGTKIRNIRKRDK